MKNVNGRRTYTDGRMPDHGYTVSSPGEPAAQLSLKPTICTAAIMVMNVHFLYLNAYIQNLVTNGPVVYDKRKF